VGVIADMANKLAKAHINITAVDAVAAGRRRYGAILWVKPRNVAKAAEILGTA
jgi:predicted amino acid-binding ACT domain protein